MDLKADDVNVWKVDSMDVWKADNVNTFSSIWCLYAYIEKGVWGSR